MKNWMIRLTSALAIAGIVTVCFVVVGCGEKRPDPRANPDFNEKAFTDPMSVQMQPLPKKGSKGK